MHYSPLHLWPYPAFRGCHSRCLWVPLRSRAGDRVSPLPSLWQYRILPFLNERPPPFACHSRSNMAVLKCKWEGPARENTRLTATRWELLVNKMQIKYSKFFFFFCKTAKAIYFTFFCLIGLTSQCSILINSRRSMTWIRATCIWSI